jgi:mono/diheme cytochrome c family protein
MRKRKIAPVAAAVMFVVVPAFVLTAKRPRAQKEEGPAARMSEAPATARLMKNPYAGDAQAVAAGHKLFHEHCAECHGTDARGLGHAANLHSAAVQNARPGAIFWAIRNGRIRRGMPSWSHLPDQELWQLVTFVDSLQHVEEPVDPRAASHCPR